MTSERESFIAGRWYLRHSTDDAYYVEFPKDKGTEKSGAILTLPKQKLPFVVAGETPTLFDCYVVGVCKLEVETHAHRVFSIRRKFQQKSIDAPEKQAMVVEKTTIVENPTTIAPENQTTTVALENQTTTVEKQTATVEKAADNHPPSFPESPAATVENQTTTVKKRTTVVEKAPGMSVKSVNNPSFAYVPESPPSAEVPNSALCQKEVCPSTPPTPKNSGWHNCRPIPNSALCPEEVCPSTPPTPKNSGWHNCRPNRPICTIAGQTQVQQTTTASPKARNTKKRKNDPVQRPKNDPRQRPTEVADDNYDSCDSFIDNRPDDLLSSFESELDLADVDFHPSPKKIPKQKKRVRRRIRTRIAVESDEGEDKKHTDAFGPNIGFGESETMKRLQPLATSHGITNDDIATQMRLFQKKLTTEEMRLNWNDPTVALAWLLMERVPDACDAILLEERSSQWERFSDAIVSLSSDGEVLATLSALCPPSTSYVALPFSGVVLVMGDKYFGFDDWRNAILLFYTTELSNAGYERAQCANEIEFAPGAVATDAPRYNDDIRYRWLPTWKEYAKNKSLDDGAKPSFLPVSAVFARLALVPWALRVALAPNYNTSMHAHAQKYPRRIEVKSDLDVYHVLELYYANVKQIWRTSLGTYIWERYVLPFKNFGQRADADIYSMLQDVRCNTKDEFHEDVIDPMEHGRCNACLLQRTLSVKCVGASGKIYSIGSECAERLRYLAAVMRSMLEFRAICTVSFTLLDKLDAVRDMFQEQQRMHPKTR